jgi:hypothetical protein
VIPLIPFDYSFPEIEILPYREGETATKKMIIQTALAGRRVPPKTSKHRMIADGGLRHISISKRTSIFLWKN